MTAQGGIDKLGDGTLVLSGENKSGNGIEIYDGVLHQAGGSLTVSNAAVSIGAYDEKSSGRLIVSQGAILTAPAISGSSATEAERNSELVVDNASLSPLAGDLDNFGPKLLHRWSFNGNLDDSVGGLAATTNGACSYSANGKSLVLAGGTYGSSYVSLGADILPKDADAATVEIWARQDTATTGAAIFDIGINDYYFAGMRWNLQGKTSRDYIEIKHSSSKSATDKLKPYTLGTEFHIAITYYKDATNKWWATAYKQDATTGETLATTTFEAPANWSLATMYQDNSYLGHCVRSGSQDAAATYNEVRVWNGRLTEAELTASALRGSDAPEMFVEGVKGVVIGGGGMTVDTGANDVTISSPISSVCADALVHRWSFNGNLDDSVGGQTAATNGACSYSADGKSLVLAGGTRGSSYVGLGADILPKDADAATIEIWARQDTTTTGAQIFDIGINDYYFAGMRWNLEGKTSRDYIEIKHNGSSKSATDQLKPYTLGTEFHIAITYYKDATNKWWATAYKQDATTGETLAKTTFEAPTNNWSLATMYQDYCYLGHSVRAGSQDAAATYNEVRVWRGMLTEEELTRNALLGPDSAFRATGAAALNKTGSGTLAIEDASSTRGKIRVAEGVLKLKSADALPQPATIEVAFDGNGGHGVLSCERGVVDLSGISLNVTGTPRGRTCIIESADGFTGKFALKSLPAGYAVDVSGTSVEVVFRGMALIVR